MTNNDELALKLKAAAYRVKEFGGIANYSKSVGVETAFRQGATPDNILALLAERDADKKLIAELDQRVLDYAGIATARAQHVFNLEKRIAELEARTVSVKLPVVPSQYETLKLCLEPSDGYGMQKGAEYMRDEFIKALAAAGIKLEVGE